MRQLVLLSVASLIILTKTVVVDAATITFQNLNVDPNQTVIEDGMRYTTPVNFIVRTFVGNPPSGLIASPGTSTFNIMRNDNGAFTLDRYDFGSIAPGEQSDTWLFRGLLQGVEQFAFVDTTSSGFVTRTMAQLGVIDRLELSVVTPSEAAGVADNFIFTLVPEPSSLSMVGVTGLLGLGYVLCRHTARNLSNR
jgi:hypothetical protein